MSIGLILTGPYVIALIFERGVFDASGTIATTIAFTGYTSFMIAFGFIDVLNKAYYTLGIRKIPLLIGGFIILVNIGLNNLLVGKYGFAGIANGTSIAFYCGAILSFFLFSRQFSSFPLHRFFNTLFKTFMAAVVMGGGVYVLNHYLNPILSTSTKGNLAIIGIDIIIGMAIYGLTLILLKEQLIYNIYIQIRDRFKKSHA
jgi:putative peptidoglycan lipid II flippase